MPSLPCSYYSKAKAIRRCFGKQNNCPRFGNKSTSPRTPTEQACGLRAADCGREGVKNKQKLIVCFSFVRDAVLTNHVIAKHQVTSVIDCAHRCMRESRCVSFNFEDHSTSPGHLCQINDEKKQNNFESFIGLDGFSYFEFEVSN